MEYFTLYGIDTIEKYTICYDTFFLTFHFFTLLIANINFFTDLLKVFVTFASNLQNI